jgi:hypothetical protein
MAKHRFVNNRRRSAIVLAALLTGAMIAPAVATADSGPFIGQLRAKASNNVDTAACSFTVQSVNYDDGTVLAQMGTQANPSSPLGYLSIAHNRSACYLLNSQHAPLTSIVADGDSPSVGTGIVPVVVPQDSVYYLCVQGQATLHSGVQSTTPLVCEGP